MPSLTPYNVLFGLTVLQLYSFSSKQLLYSMPANIGWWAGVFLIIYSFQDWRLNASVLRVYHFASWKIVMGLYHAKSLSPLMAKSPTMNIETVWKLNLLENPTQGHPVWADFCPASLLCRWCLLDGHETTSCHILHPEWAQAQALSSFSLCLAAYSSVWICPAGIHRWSELLLLDCLEDPWTGAVLLLLQWGLNRKDTILAESSVPFAQDYNHWSTFCMWFLAPSRSNGLHWHTLYRLSHLLTPHCSCYNIHNIQYTIYNISHILWANMMDSSCM